MLTVILIILILIYIGLKVIQLTFFHKSPEAMILPIILCVVLFFLDGLLIVSDFFIVSDGVVIEDRIAMYEQQNAEIEAKLDTLVQDYLEYEGETYSKFQDGDGITLVQLYPDLKANELVQKEMEVYTQNNAKIIDLKNQMCDIEVAKWRLLIGYHRKEIQ